MRIIDTHLHLIYPERLRYDWLADTPALNRPWSVDDYFAEAAPLGIEAALHMEVDVAEADMFAETAFISTLDPRVIGLIAAARPEQEGFAAQLDRICQSSRVRGLRRVLHVVPDEVSQTALFRANLRLLAARNLSFDLCLRADQLGLGMALADAAPEVQFVLDHCGVPTMRAEDFSHWQAQITEMARRENVAGKVSGIIAYDDAPTAARLRPYIRHMIDAFGWERLVWGSDHPVCTQGGTLTDWVGIARALVAEDSEAEQAALFAGNAARIYRL